MTTIDLIKQIFEVCIIPLFGVLTVYITSLIPDCIIAFAHSLHGNKVTYILLCFSVEPV